MAEPVQLGPLRKTGLLLCLGGGALFLISLLFCLWRLHPAVFCVGLGVGVFLAGKFILDTY